MSKKQKQKYQNSTKNFPVENSCILLDFTRFSKIESIIDERKVLMHINSQ